MNNLTSNRGHVQSCQHGITPEAPPRPSNAERAKMRKATNDFLKASEVRMAKHVKFYPKRVDTIQIEESNLSACAGTPVNIG